MSMTIRAHFDGKVIVPDEPVDLPVNQPFELQLSIPVRKDARPEGQWREALERLASRAIHGLNIPDEALSRENLYEERE